MNDDFLASMSGLLGNFQQRLATLKAEAAALEATAQAGGMVTAVATGDGRIVRVTIEPAALADRELLEDMITAATNEALRSASEASAAKLKQLTSELGLPPGMLP